MEMAIEKLQMTLPNNDDNDYDEIEHDHLLDFHHRHHQTLSSSTTRIMTPTSTKRKTENVLKFSTVSLLIIFYTYRWSSQNQQQRSSSIDSFARQPSSDPNIVELNNYRLCCALLITTVIILLIFEKLFGIHIGVIRTDSNRRLLSANSSGLCSNRNVDSDGGNNRYPIRMSLIWFVLPWRSLSRLWGWLNQIPLPEFMRRPIFLLYARIFGCNLLEIENKNLTEFENLSQFFRRSLLPEMRPISYQADLVSPADGTVVQFAMVPTNGGYIGNVKGIRYSIESFLGPNSNYYPEFNRDWSLRQSATSSGKRLFALAIYLAPGDYHRFHSPADWIIERRRHFSGNLLSVRPSFVAQISNLFSINERAVYFGRWKHGMFTMAAVGATNVGSINVIPDPELRTNRFRMETTTTIDCNEKLFQKSIRQQKGQLFGEFNLGSTIVLIFEAPESYFDKHSLDFHSLINRKIHYGQSI